MPSTQSTEEDYSVQNPKLKPNSKEQESFRSEGHKENSTHATGHTNRKNINSSHLLNLQYIFGDEKPSNVSFGTTQSRPVFPMAMPPTRFGNEIKPIRGQPNTGPGAYENEDQTNFKYLADHKLTSKKGYTMGARTGPRFRKEFIEITPAPDTYQTHCTDLRMFMPAYKPFNYEAERFPITKYDIEQAVPGPGCYEHDITRNRKVQWHQSFGSAPIKLPEVQIKSTIGSNTTKLLSTRDAKNYQRKLAYLKLYWD